MLKFRDYPYPYNSMLAICSDLDKTPSPEAYFAICRYMNTREMTPIGQGVGLEVGNTLFFDMAPGEYAYWSGCERAQDMTRALIRSGHIDCFHSYGDNADTRAHAQRALEELERHGLKLPVWVDHGLAISNFGPDIMVGKGDVPGHPVYHADLTIAHGVRYVWLGRVTSCIGQNAPYSLRTSLSAERSLKSLVTTAKDYTKRMRGAMRYPKYAMHRGNALMRPYTLRDGQVVTEFMRSNPHPHGVSAGDHAQGFGEALNANALQHLVERRGVSIIYTHLGKDVRGCQLFPDHTREAFERLADREQGGDILVASTVRLLDYVSAREAADAELKDGVVELTLPNHLPADGLTWACEGETPPVRLNGEPIEVVRHDDAGRSWLSVPWRRPTFPL